MDADQSNRGGKKTTPGIGCDLSSAMRKKSQAEATAAGAWLIYLPCLTVWLSGFYAFCSILPSVAGQSFATEGH